MSNPIARLVTSALVLILAASAKAEPPAAGTFRGQVLITGKVARLTPCAGTAGDRVRRLHDATAGDLARTYRALGGTHAAARYMELRAVPGTTPDVLRVIEVVRAAAEGFGCAEQWGSATFRARGNEPFWNVEIGPEHIALQRMGVSPVYVPVVEADRSSGAAIYRAKTEATEFTMQVARTRCADSMSGERFSHTVAVTVNGVSLAGCGAHRPGDLPLP